MTAVKFKTEREVRQKGTISADPAIAGPILKRLKRQGKDIARLEHLKSRALTKIKDQLPPVEAVSIESGRAALLNEFGIKVVGKGKVRLSLGGTSRIDFLRKVRDVAMKLHGPPAIYGPQFELWAKEAAFIAKPEKGGAVGVNGNVAKSSGKRRAEQEAKGWNNVELCDLAVAHAAYFLATGKDLFGGYAVRARNGVLRFNAHGLHVDDYGGDIRSSDIVASVALRP